MGTTPSTSTLRTTPTAQVRRRRTAAVRLRRAEPVRSRPESTGFAALDEAVMLDGYDRRPPARARV